MFVQRSGYPYNRHVLSAVESVTFQPISNATLTGRAPLLQQPYVMKFAWQGYICQTPVLQSFGLAWQGLWAYLSPCFPLFMAVLLGGVMDSTFPLDPVLQDTKFPSSRFSGLPLTHPLSLLLKIRRRMASRERHLSLILLLFPNGHRHWWISVPWTVPHLVTAVGNARLHTACRIHCY